MGIISSTLLKPEHRSQNNNHVPFLSSEKVGVSSSTWRQYDLYMKRGPCKQVFTDFQDCVHEAEKKKEASGPCYSILKKCMEAHSDYYRPILASDEAAEEVLFEGIMKAFQPSNEEEAEKFTTFMEGGACKKSFTAWNADCNFTEEDNNEVLVTKCAGLFGTLIRCVVDHSDYYHPLLSVVKDTEDHLVKDLKALFPKAS